MRRERFAAGPVDGLAGMEAVARHAGGGELRARRWRGETSARVDGPARHRRIVAARVAAHHAAQRLGQQREADASAATARRRRGARGPSPSSQSASAARWPTARCVGTWSITSLTPVMTIATSAVDRRRWPAATRGRRASSGRSSRAASSATGRPVRAVQRAREVAGDGAGPGARRRRPAADESPAIEDADRRRRRRRRRGPRARRAASGSTGARRRVAQRLRDQQRRERELERSAARARPGWRDAAAARSEAARSRACASGRRR